MTSNAPKSRELTATQFPKADPTGPLSGDITPGPGAYTLDSASLMRAAYKSSPAYTIASKHNISEPYRSPGPCYLVNRCPHKQQAPSYTFGNRNTRYKAAPFIVQHKD